MPVPSSPNLQVSNKGRVRSVPRVTTRVDGRVLPVRGRVLKQFTNSKGYKRVTNPQGSALVHRLVAEAFHGPSDQQVRHLNGDPADNRPENLTYGTNSQNQIDSVTHGTHHMARRTHCPQGHEYTDDNTTHVRLVGGKPYGRRCLACARARAREYRARKRAAH